MTGPAGQPARAIPDALDVALLSLLDDDARTPVLELARRLGVARGTAQARLDRLRACGLGRLAAQVDLAAAGFAVQAFTTVEISQGAGHEVAARLGAMPHVLAAWTITGPGDLLVHLAAASHAELQSVLDAVLAVDGVARTSTVVALTQPVPYRTLPLARLAAARGRTSRSSSAPAAEAPSK